MGRSMTYYVCAGTLAPSYCGYTKNLVYTMYISVTIDGYYVVVIGEYVKANYNVAEIMKPGKISTFLL